MSTTFEQLQEALLHRVGFEVVTSTVKDTQVRLVGRVRQSRMPTWLEAMTQLLLRSEKDAWSLDLSRQYFVRDQKLLYGWRIIIQAPDVAQRLPQISAIIQNIKPVMQQVEEVALNANPNRNVPRRGRGAQPLGTAVVGPGAKAQLGM